jgi:hypothetical protein
MFQLLSLTLMRHAPRLQHAVKLPHYSVTALPRRGRQSRYTFTRRRASAPRLLNLKLSVQLQQQVVLFASAPLTVFTPSIDSRRCYYVEEPGRKFAV